MKQIKCKKNSTVQQVWVDEDPKLKEGNFIRFKDEKEFWLIEKVYDLSINKDELYKTWHVGGL